MKVDKMVYERAKTEDWQQTMGREDDLAHIFYKCNIQHFDIADQPGLQTGMVVSFHRIFCRRAVVVQTATFLGEQTSLRLLAPMVPDNWSVVTFDCTRGDRLKRRTLTKCKIFAFYLLTFRYAFLCLQWLINNRNNTFYYFNEFY